METVEQIQEEAVVLKEKCRSLKIVDELSRKAKESYGLQAKKNIDRLKALLKPKKDFHHAKHKKMCELEKKLCKPHEEILKEIKKEVNEYAREQEKLQREAARKAEEAARKAQEEQRLAQAKEAARMGGNEAAEAILNAPLPAVSIQPQKVKRFKGSRTTYFGEVTDLKELMQAALENDTLMSYIEPNQKAIDATIRGCSGQVKIPGVTVRTKE